MPGIQAPTIRESAERASPAAQAKGYFEAAEAQQGVLRARFGEAVTDGAGDPVSVIDRRLAQERELINQHLQRADEMGEKTLGPVAAAAQGQAQLRQREKEKEKKGLDPLTLMLMQDIARIEREIASLEARIDAIEERVFTAEERARFEALPEEERRRAKDAAMRERVARGEMTQAEYEEWQKLQDEIAAKRKELEVKKEQYNDLTLANDTGKSIDFTKPHYDDLVNSYLTAGHEFNRESPSEEDISALRQFELRKSAKEDQQLAQSEKRVVTLEGLADYKGADRIQKIDDFIKNAGHDLLSKIENDPTTNDEIKTRIGVMNLKTELAEIEAELQGAPELAEEINFAIANAPDNVREALANEENLSPVVTSALYKPFSDTLDKKEISDLALGSNTTAATTPATKPPGFG